MMLLRRDDHGWLSWTNDRTLPDDEQNNMYVSLLAWYWGFWIGLYEYKIEVHDAAPPQ